MTSRFVSFALIAFFLAQGCATGKDRKPASAEEQSKSAYEREVSSRLNRCISAKFFLEKRDPELVASRLGSTCGGEKPATVFKAIAKTSTDQLWVYKNFAYDFDNERLEAAFDGRQGAIEALRNFLDTFARQVERPLASSEKKAKRRRERELQQGGQMVRLMASLKGVFVADLAASQEGAEVVVTKALEIPREASCALAIGTGIRIAADGQDSGSKHATPSFVAKAKKQIKMIPKSQCNAEIKHARKALDASLKNGMTVADFMHQSGREFLSVEQLN